MEEAKREPEKNFVHVEPVHHEKKSLTDKFRKNPWIVSTFVFGIIILILLLGGFNLTGKAIATSQAEQNFLTLASQQLTNVQVNSIEKQSPFYKISFTSTETQNSSVYETLDGNFLVTGLIPLSNTAIPSSSNNQQAQTTVPKTAKPSVELYVFAYCPYGLQMEKAMIPVVKLLGSKIDFRIRQIGAMHDPQGCSGSACFEKTEAQRQLCIEKYYPDKYLDYLLAFAQDTSCQTGDSACVTTKTTALFAKFGMDASKINSCMPTDGLTMYNAEVANANSKGVSGSPTLKINGADSQASRSPDGILTAVCSAFSTSPSECSQKLSTTQAAAGFGSGSSSSSSTGVQCG
jgi:hypothetical protein